MTFAPGANERLLFLRNCFVEGDSAQEARVRRNKRRALLVSVFFQILIVATLVIFPLFGKGENIVSRVIAFPTVPYAPGRTHNRVSTTAQQPGGNSQPCRFCPPPSTPHTVVTHDMGPIVDPDGPGGPSIPGLPEGPNVSGGLTPTDSHREPPPPVTPPNATERHRISEPVIAAKLIHRVEPVYPPLGVQLRREGRVELHAIISTDGSIQSLEVITGDPILIPSALAAVREWRYQPTILNGQPVEVDTHITVIYTLAR